MTDIAKLPDKWRKGKMYVERDDSISRYPAFAKECADDLEAALPVWTKITDDPDTSPEDVDCLAIWSHMDITEQLFFHAVKGKFKPNKLTYWRPLCSIDYPPEDTHE